MKQPFDFIDELEKKINKETPKKETQEEYMRRKYPGLLKKIE